jgi:hypothetical protein
MNREQRIPDFETKMHSVTKLRELIKQMDRHISDLDELNIYLEADFQQSIIGAYQKKRAERLLSQD